MYSQRDFFNAVLPQGGHPCIAWKSDGMSGFAHKVFNSIDEFCEYTERVDFSKANFYFCISSLREPSVVVGGKSRIRVQQNAHLTRCIVLDIDFKDGHYAGVDEALEAVNALADSMKMPHPIAVSSGNGLHIYWPFAAGIESKEWTKLTKLFRSTASLFHPHLFADSSRVSDSAGVLRVPESFNLKYDTPRPVEIVQWMDGELDIGVLRRNFPTETPQTTPKVTLAPAVAAQPPAQLAAVVKNCNWVAQYLKHRESASEPEWYAMLGLAPFIEHKDADTGRVINGADIAQVVSKGHAGYDPDVASIKYEQAKANQTGPTTCERLRGLDPSRCEGCPFATAVKTPIQASYLARPATAIQTVETVIKDEDGNAQETVVTVPLYPSPYFRGEDGGVFLRAKEKQEDGSWADVIERVYDYDLYPIKRYRTEGVEAELMEVHLWLPHDGLRVFKLPTALLAEQKKLATFLAEKGVVPESGRGPRVAKYMVDYVRHLQTVGAAEVEFSRFGWRDAKSANPKFVVGNGYIDKSGALQPATFAHFLKDAAKSVATAGTLEGWKEGFNVYKDVPNSDAFILASLMGFAAPLMAFTPYRGVLYNMVGHSAAGKSTALQVMTSVWGQPQDTHIKIAGGRGRDTEVAIYNLIGYLNAVPVAMDELTNMEPEALSDFALSFTSGRGKMRADRNGQNRLNETEWETIVVGTSNTSLYDKLASHRKGYTAEAMRIFELTLPPSDDHFKGHVEQHISLLQKNYGHAGRAYMEYVIKNIPSIQEALVRATAAITKSGQLRNEERFWGALFACVLVGGSIAQKLGLHSYDIKSIVEKFTSYAPEIREAVRTSQTDPVSLLSEFFNTNLDGIIKFNMDGKPYMGADNRALSMLRAVIVRMELDKENTPDKAYISIPALRTYCEAKRIDPAWLYKELKSLGVIEGSKAMRLASGSGIASTTLKAYVVDMKHERLMGMGVDLLEIAPIEEENEDEDS